MTQDEIIDMSRQAGIGLEDECHYQIINLEELKAFAKLVAEREKERIIAMLKSLDEQCNEDGGYDEPTREYCIWAIKGEI